MSSVNKSNSKQELKTGLTVGLGCKSGCTGVVVFFFFFKVAQRGWSRGGRLSKAAGGPNPNAGPASSRSGEHSAPEMHEKAH